VEASRHKPPTRLHSYEGKAESASRRDDINTETAWMDATTIGTRPKRYGYLGRKNQRKSRRKRKRKSYDNVRRIYTTRRVYAKTRRRKTERFTRS